MKKLVARTVLMVEMQISDPENAKDQIAVALDRFREATQPSNDWGITLWLATRKDLENMAASGDLLPNPGTQIDEVDDSDSRH